MFRVRIQISATPGKPFDFFWLPQAAEKITDAERSYVTAVKAHLKSMMKEAKKP